MQRRRIILLLLVSLLVFNLCVVANADDEKENTKEYIKWSTLSGKETENLNSVAYGGGRFVAVGSGGVIQVSEDGVKWRRIDWNNQIELHQVAFNGKLFVAVGDRMIIKSYDGLKWEKALELQNKVDYGDGYNPRFLNILWNGECFYAFGQGRFYSSADGTVWKQCYESEISHNSSAFDGTTIESLAFSKDKAVAIAVEKNFRIIMTSEDGGTWVKKNAPNISYATYPSVYFNGKYFIVLGVKSLIYSEDGIKWAIKNDKQPFIALSWVKRISGIYYGSDGKSLYKSADGFAWEETGLTDSKIGINDIAWDGKETLIVVGDNGLILQYGKNDIWANVGEDIYFPTNSAATDEKVMVGIGDYGQILVTKDGNKWDRVKAVTDKSMQYIIYAEKRFIAAGEGGEILVSYNG